MDTEIKTLELTSIREQDRDEYWLQEYIWNNPSCLGLGDLEPIAKEKKQTSGGRLDLLMKGSDEELYEIEIMLGKTDETHIIRTIEYWDIEKRKRPKRQHTAILVAERINTRFYNVINLLSHSVPIIGIQANFYKNNGSVSLVFTKIIDSFEEPELEEENGSTYGADYIKKSFPETSQVINTIISIVKEGESDTRVNYIKKGASIYINGTRKIIIASRAKKQSSVAYVVSDEDRSKIEELLDSSSISYDYKYGKVRVWLDNESLNKNIEAHREIIKRL
ncbi:MAG: hypothetical protein JMN24_18720 [gamma proteobacterium endosymbiont of Lamellibrachia anaximandri]|nr:hypothetical protein [gamma proteobacterium endosymbiont of Lamellibrachia anaximandri]